MEGVRTPVGTLRVLLSCTACGTRSHPCFVEGVLDADGDLAVPSEHIAWFTDAHYLPVVTVI